jgi:hypothetical protein
LASEPEHDALFELPDLVGAQRGDETGTEVDRTPRPFRLAEVATHVVEVALPSHPHGEQLLGADRCQHLLSEGAAMDEQDAVTSARTAAARALAANPAVSTDTPVAEGVAWSSDSPNSGPGTSASRT